jgi:hypothetical protein
LTSDSDLSNQELAELAVDGDPAAQLLTAEFWHSLMSYARRLGDNGVVKAPEGGFVVSLKGWLRDCERQTTAWRDVYGNRQALALLEDCSSEYAELIHDYLVWILHGCMFVSSSESSLISERDAARELAGRIDSLRWLPEASQPAPSPIGRKRTHYIEPMSARQAPDGCEAAANRRRGIKRKRS